MNDLILNLKNSNLYSKEIAEIIGTNRGAIVRLKHDKEPFPETLIYSESGKLFLLYR